MSKKSEWKLSKPFSWRGLYDEVCFTLENVPSTVKENLDNINKAYDEVFTGWKGGNYRYDDYTEVHFESSHRSYSDGEYCLEMIEKISISGDEQSKDNETKLIELAFEG